MSLTLKQRCHQACLDLMDDRVERLRTVIAETQEAASEEAKSSAADKFETSREMMKLEIDKNVKLLSQASDMLKYLHQIKPEKSKSTIEFGSLALTNEGTYYFSVSLGKVPLAEGPFFALSMASPIGKAMVNAKAGDVISFMGRKIQIKEIQ